MSYVARRVTRIMEKHGTPMVLKRTGAADLAVKGKRLGSSEDDTGNAAAQSQQTIKIGNAEILAAAWPGPPQRKDKLQLGAGGRTLTVIHVDTRKDGIVELMHFLTCIG